MKKIGFIGLGIMGKPMVKNLLKAGFEVTAYDILPAAVQEMAEAGAIAGTSPKQAAQGKDVVITMVPSGPIVRSLLEGEDGVLAGIPEGAVIVDMSSVTAIESQEFAKLAESKGCHFLDAPVSGGEPGAVAGTLAIMIGGKQEVVDKVHDVFEAMGSSITLIGPNGSGSIAKLANQVIVNLNIAAVSEALILATKAGADPKLLMAPWRQHQRPRMKKACVRLRKWHWMWQHSEACMPTVFILWVLKKAWVSI